MNAENDRFTLAVILCLGLLYTGPFPADLRATAVAPSEAVLLDDNYSAMTPGLLFDVVGAHAEYHYLPETQPKGNWTVACYRSDQGQRAWRLIEQDGQRLMWQSYMAAITELPYTHPMLTAGDELWTDYTVAVRFAPESDRYRSGVGFRYHTSRVYYFAGVIGQKATIRKINNGRGYSRMNETVLAEQPFAWNRNEFISLKVTASGDALVADFGNGVRLEAHDSDFKQGKICLTSDVPTRYAAVTVTCPAAEKAAFDAAHKSREAEEARLEAENPKLVLWKKISTSGFGTGRSLRFGDLEGKGNTDILVVQQNPHGPKDTHTEVGCMTAITLDGTRLWQNGTPDSWHDRLTNDVAVQIHDIDGDGKNEVIYCRDMEIVVADGATGKTKYKVPTPESPGNEERKDLYPRILGDALYFADLRGLGAKRDLLIKDRYWNIWAYTDKLEQEWHLALNTGHYPYACDLRGQGKDDLMVGYSMVSHDGKIIWSLEKQLAPSPQHADGVAVAPLKDGEPPKVLFAASDDGFVLSDISGKILEHLHIGHVQNPTVAKLRPDLPGLQMATINFWGNQGIVSFYDADGKIYHDFEPVPHGSMMLPLNWKGDGQEYWILSSNPTYGGVYDGWGRRVMRFPADGHPDMCVATLNLTGDCRDEIVCWDPHEIWIYTQSDNPKPGRLYKPQRNPMFNESNYRANVSLPGWSE